MKKFYDRRSFFERKISSDAVGRSVAFMRAMSREEDLKNKKLTPSDVGEIYRFTQAVSSGQIKTLLPEDAVTLWKLIPALEVAAAPRAIHGAIILGADSVLDLYANAAPDSPEKQALHDLFIQTGNVCFDPRLISTTVENRKLEFDIFSQFKNELPNYETAWNHFLHGRNQALRNDLILNRMRTPYDGRYRTFFPHER